MPIDPRRLPPDGSPMKIPYKCVKCGESFMYEPPNMFSKRVRCPKCKSYECITPVKW